MLLRKIHSSYAHQEVRPAGAGADAEGALGGAATTPFADQADMGAPRRTAACSISCRVKITRGDTLSGSSTLARFTGRGGG